jgi:hypothetical protein
MVLIRSDTSAAVDALSRLLQEVAAALDVGLTVVLACDANGLPRPRSIPSCAHARNR